MRQHNLLIALLIALAIPLSVYVATQPQDIRNRASGEEGKPIAPYLTISSPVDGEKVSDARPINVAILNEANVVGVEIYIDHKPRGVVTNRPFSYVWESVAAEAPGPHTITARAFDDAGNVGTKTITVYKQ